MTLRICMVISRGVRSKGGGAVYRVITLAKYLSKEGLEVFIVDGERNSYIKVICGQFITKRLPRSLFVTVLSYVPNFIDRLVTFLLRFPKDEAGRISNAFNISLFLDLLRVALRERPDIIQVEEYPALVPLTFIIKKMVGSVLLFLSEHNVETHRLMRDSRCGNLPVRFMQILERVACRLGDCVLVVSELDAYRLRTLTGHAGRTEVVPNFVDSEVIEQQLGEHDDVATEFKSCRPLLIFHGDFRYFPNREAVHLLVTEVLPKIVKKYPRARLLIMGPGSKKITYQNVVSEGYVEELYKLISKADVAVVPILRGGGTRIKILEYMACKVPVVSTAIGAEGLDDCKDVILAYTMGSLVKGIIRIIEDSNLREQLIMNAKKRIREKYNAKNVARKVKLIYLDHVKR